MATKTHPYPTKLAKVLQDEFGVNILNAPPEAASWSLALLPKQDRVDQVNWANDLRQLNGIIPFYVV